METIVNLISQNGIGVVCVAFMIYFINTTLKDNNTILSEIQKTLVSVQSILTCLTERVDKIEDKVNRKEN